MKKENYTFSACFSSDVKQNVNSDKYSCNIDNYTYNANLDNTQCYY